MSLDVYQRRMHVQQQINTLVHEVSNQAHAFKEQYSIQIKQARNQWNANRLHFENERMQKLLPSRRGINPTGTQTTQSFRASQDRVALGINKEVGTCLADIVDAVDSIAQGAVQNERFSEPFVVPPPPPGYDPEALERGKQLESSKRNELNNLTLRQRNSEDERNRAWKKLLKVKGEHRMQHQILTGGGTFRWIPLDPNNCSRFPMPELQHSSFEHLQQGGAHLDSVSSFPPQARWAPPAGSGDNSSRYSLSAVRRRIAVDGSVAPASTPKKNKEGLYLRPKGRPRHGMEWDAVGGKWVPSAEKK